MFECDCSVDHDDYERATVSEIKTRTARKEHQCEECRERILPGQQYEFAKGLWDGVWESYKTCLPCVAIRERFCPRGWLYGMLAETIQDCLGFNYMEDPSEWDAAERSKIDREDEEHREYWIKIKKERGER